MTKIVSKWYVNEPRIRYISYLEIMESNLYRSGRLWRWTDSHVNVTMMLQYDMCWRMFQLNNVESCCVLDGKWNYNFLFRVRSCVPLFVLFSFAWDSSVANKSRKMLSTVVYAGMKVILWDRYKHFAIFATIIACMIHAFSLFECLLNFLFRLRKIIIILTW